MKIGKEIKQSNFDSAKAKVLINVMYTSNKLITAQNQFLKVHGIQSQHYNILRIIKGKHPQPTSPGHIKDVMLDKGRDLTRLLDKLEKATLITRSLNENNRRMIDVSLTPQGKTLSDTLDKEVNHWIENTINLSDNDAHTLSDLLDHLRH
jgi:DNA-binding MarR family transcriptional regulator